MQSFRLRFALVLLAFVVLALVGGLGYVLLEDWSLKDGLYMAVITLTAVGYGEVHPLTDTGRTFTIGLLVAGISWMGIWFAMITSFLVELDLRQVLRSRLRMKQLEKISDHVVVCGCGRTGMQVVEELEAMKTRWVVVERDPARIHALELRFPEGLVVEGEATHDETLLQAGLERARGLIACLSADADNLFVCLSARALKPGIKIVARAYEDETTDKILRAGADHVVSPNVSGALRMASMLVRPSVVSFLDVATRSSGMDLRIEQAVVPEGSSLDGQTLEEAAIPQATGLIVIAVKRAAGTTAHPFTFNPSAALRLSHGDELIVLGTPDQISKLRKYVAGRSDSL